MRLQLAHFVNRQRVCRVVTLRPSSLPVAKFQIGYLDSILLVDFGEMLMPPDYADLLYASSIAWPLKTRFSLCCAATKLSITVQSCIGFNNGCTVT